MEVLLTMRFVAIACFPGVEEGRPKVHQLRHVVHARILIYHHNDRAAVTRVRRKPYQVNRLNHVLSMRVGCSNDTFGNMISSLFAENMVRHAGNHRFLHNGNICAIDVMRIRGSGCGIATPVAVW